MKAIILAAGASRRLKKYTQNTPKCLLNVGEKRILERQLDILVQNQIKDVVIVVGYLKHMIIEFVNENYKNLNVKFIENANYANTNTIYSLWLVRDEMLKDNFIYFNADVLYHPNILKRLLQSEYLNCLAIDKKQCGEEEVKVINNSNGRINSIGKKLDIEKCAGEFIGVGKFSKKGNKSFVKYLEQGIRKNLVMEYFEYAVNNMLSENPVYEVDVSDLPCMEIDFPEDLETARKQICW